MLSKLEKTQNAIADWKSGLVCPVCGASLNGVDKRLKCPKGHSWDINRKGFVNLLSRPHETYYDEALFAARSRIFQAGFYEPLAKELLKRLKAGSYVLDAGCGEGYYLDWLAHRMELVGCGMDISRPAIQQAACHESPQLWLVGDVTRLPFASHSLDAILDILTPASYQAFWQVLKPEGVLLKVYPGSRYLKEIREAMGLPLYEEGAVEAYATKNAKLLERVEICVTQPVTPEQYRDFVFMTPLTQRMSPEEKEALAAKPAKDMTLHLILAVLAPPEKSFADETACVII